MFINVAELHLALEQHYREAAARRAHHLKLAGIAQQQADQQRLLHSKLRRNKECQGCGAPLGLAKLCSYCGTAA
jgi:hypothetical protein